jgi:putative acetyltransferase
MTVQVCAESADQPEVIALIAELDAYQAGLYPPESCHRLDIRSLTQPHVLFAVARAADGRAVGCAAIVLAPPSAADEAAPPGHGELKRMYVQPAHRGAGTATRLLAWLEAQARARGCPRVLLETGPYQPEALAFYARHGYVRRGPFADYWDDPLSVFMEKPLHPAPPA